MRTRANLDDFISIACFKAAIVGMEDILGVEGTGSLLIAAGRKRGRDVAQSYGLTGTNPPAATLVQTLDNALGINGTRLCGVAEVQNTPEGGYLVKTKETVCTAGEPPGSQRSCTYTLGAVMGFLEAASGKNFSGKHVSNILNGGATDDFLFTPV